MSNHAAAYDRAILLRQRVDTPELTELQRLRLRLRRAEATTVRAGLFHDKDRCGVAGRHDGSPKSSGASIREKTHHVAGMS